MYFISDLWISVKINANNFRVMLKPYLPLIVSNAGLLIITGYEWYGVYHTIYQ